MTAAQATPASAPSSLPSSRPDPLGLVWITGAGKGIGRALALHLLAEGVAVAGSARTTADLASLAAEAKARALPGALSTHPLDITDARAVARVVAMIERQRGPIRTAVLNAGTHIPMGLDDFSTATLRRLVEVNLLGTAACLEALVPLFRARTPDGAGLRGRLAVVGSVAGYRGLPTSAAYGATKAGLANMLESLKPEADAAGVRLFLVNPGFVRTPLTDRNPFPMPFLMEPEAAAARLARGLRGRSFEITFPRRLAWLLKLGRMLPDALYFALVRRVTGAGTDAASPARTDKEPAA